MRLGTCLLSAAMVLACVQLSFAGPLFPCPSAAESAHGNALAIVHQTTEWHGNSGKILRVRFTVMKKMVFVNKSQKVNAPVTLWGDWPWAVVLDTKNVADRPYDCAVPLVTEDGQFLVLLAIGPAFDSALRIYRKGSDADRMQDGTIKGALVKDIKLAELWPANKIDAVQVRTDESPQWFAGGSFDFSADGFRLIHATRWGNIDYISLRDGTVKNEPAIVPPLPH